MSTKNHPSEFGGYEKAEPDEPMFVLLARDPDAPFLLELWARIREQVGERPEKLAEARQLARDMVIWRMKMERRDEG